MATITAARQTYKDSHETTDAWCARIERTDGVIIRYTNADFNLVMTDVIDSDGAQQTLPSPVTYSTVNSYTPTAVAFRDGTEGGLVDLEAILSAAGVLRADIAQGLFADARVFTFITNYLIPIEDEEKLLAGAWGETELRDDTFITTFRSLSQLMNVVVGRTVGPKCDAVLGDARCGVQLSPPVWEATTAYAIIKPKSIGGDATVGNQVISTSTASNLVGKMHRCTLAGTSGGSEPTFNTSIGGVTVDGTVEWTTERRHILTDMSVLSVASNRSFRANTSVIGDFDAEDFANGFIEWTTGTNVGGKYDVESSATGPNVDIVLRQAPPFAIDIADEFTITVGCRKRIFEDCRDKFINVVNFQGFPDLPGEDIVTKFGGQ